MASFTTSREPYMGDHCKLIIAIDVGLTHSGAAYSLLEPEQIPEIRGINRYPGQDLYGGDSKIPTIMWYDIRTGTVRAAGAEALLEETTVTAEEEGWIKAEWFKIYMKPNMISAPPESYRIPELPLGKDVVEVFGDFLQYINTCARSYISQTHPEGESLWEKIGDEVEYVLTHPNDYGESQQDMMRKAAILGGLVNDPVSAWDGYGVMIVMAGDTTINASIYQQKSDIFEEISATESFFNGGVFVRQRARDYFERVLKGSKFADSVEVVTDAFDKFTKPVFSSKEDDYYIKFGGARDNDASVNIRAGRIRISGHDIAEFFEPSITATMDVMNDLHNNSSKEIKTIFVVGSLSSIGYFFNEIRNIAEYSMVLEENEKISVCRPDRHLHNVVALGGVTYYLHRCMNPRVSTLTYGVRINVPFNSKDEEHRKRESTKYRSGDGIWRLPDAFEPMLYRNTEVSETMEFRHSLVAIRKDLASLQRVKSAIRCYRGQLETPMWISDEPDNFSIVCTIEANLEELAKSLKPIRRPDRRGHNHVYYRAEYEVVLLFGSTIFEAFFVWQENGKEKCPPAKITFSE